jgi:hypothetical protein
MQWLLMHSPINASRHITETKLAKLWIWKEKHLRKQCWKQVSEAEISGTCIINTEFRMCIWWKVRRSYACRSWYYCKQVEKLFSENSWTFMQLLNSREPEIHSPKILVPELIINEGKIAVEKLKCKYACSNLISA